MVLPKYYILKKIIASIILVTFFSTNFDSAYALAPASKITDQSFQEDSTRHYIDGLVAQAFGLNLTTDKGFKKFLIKKFPAHNLTAFILSDITRRDDGSLCLPYRKAKGGEIILRYFLADPGSGHSTAEVVGELADGRKVCREVINPEVRYIGSPHDIYTLISSSEYMGDFVPIEALRVRTHGKKRADGSVAPLSFLTVKRDLDNLYYFGLVYKQGKGGTATYKAVPVNKKLYRVIESFLSAIPKRPNAREKSIIRNELYRIMNQEVSQADLIAAKPVMTVSRTLGSEEETVRSILYTIMTSKEVAKYKAVATAFLEALKNDYIFSEEETASIEKLKARVNSWRKDYHDIGKFQLEFEHILRSKLKLDTRILQRRGGKGLLHLEKYIITLGAIFFDPATARSPKAEPFIAHIVESAFDDSYAKDINLTAPWRSYHLWNDSAVAYWENMECLRKPPKAVYKPRLWEKAPRQSQDTELMRKIDEAVRIARQRIGNMPAGVASAMGPRDFDELLDKTTILMIDSPLPVILADPANNVVRPLSNGRRRQVLYIPKLFLADFNADNQEDMKELATHILHSVEWSYAYQRLQEKGESSDRIYEELNMLTTRFTITDRYGLVSPETIRKRLFKLMKRSLIAQCTVLTPQLLAKYNKICEWTKDLDTHYPDGYIYTEIGYGQEGDVRAAFRGLERELASGVLYFDLLGLHDMAQEFFRERERNIRIIQASDIGDLPNYLQLELVFFYLRHGDISHFLRNLEMLLTGNGFPQRSARFVQLCGKDPKVLQDEQLSVLRDFAASNLYLIQPEVEYVLESLKRVEPDPVRRDEIEHALKRAQMLIVQFKRTLAKAAQRSETKLAVVQNGQRPAGSATSVTGIKIPQREEGETQDVMLAFGKSVVGTFDQTKQFISELKGKKIKSVLIWDPYPRHLGEEARTLPILIASFLRTWPSIENVTVVTPRPELVSRISPLVHGITPREFNRQAAKFEEERPEVVINFAQSISRPNVLGSIKTIRDMGLVFYLVVRRVYEGVVPLTYPEAVYATLKAFELDVPPAYEPIYGRQEVEQKMVFVNPHSVTNREYFEKAKDSWVDIIVRLIRDKGYKVVLNDGEPEKDNQNTLMLVNAVRAKLGETESFDVFVGNIQKLCEIINRAEGIITVDSAVNQLAILSGVPCLIITTPHSKYWVSSIERTVPFEDFARNSDTAIEKFLAPTALGRITNIKVMVQLQKLQAQGIADIEVINDMAFGDMPKVVRMPINEAIAHAQTKQLFMDTQGRFHLFGGGVSADNTASDEPGGAPLSKAEKRSLRDAMASYGSAVEEFERHYFVTMASLKDAAEKVKAFRPPKASQYDLFSSGLAKFDKRLEGSRKEKLANIRKKFTYYSESLLQELRKYARGGDMLGMAEYERIKNHQIAKYNGLYGADLLAAGSPEAAELQGPVARLDQDARKTIERNCMDQQAFDKEPIERFSGAIPVSYLMPGSHYEMDGFELVLHRDRYPDKNDRKNNWGQNADYFFEIRKDGAIKDRLYFCVRKDGDGKPAIEVSMSFSEIAAAPFNKIPAFRWLWQKMRENGQTFKAYLVTKEDTALIPDFFETCGTCSNSDAKLLDRDPEPIVLAALLEEEKMIAIAGKLSPISPLFVPPLSDSELQSVAKMAVQLSLKPVDDLEDSVEAPWRFIKRGGDHVIFEYTSASGVKYAVITGRNSLEDAIFRAQRSIFDVLNPDGRRRDLPYLVQEYKEKDRTVFIERFLPPGTTLDLVDVSKWSSRQKAAVASSIARTLQYMHSKNVVHRDFCPRNIWIPKALIDGPDDVQNHPPIVFDFSESFLQKANMGAGRYAEATLHDNDLKPGRKTVYERMSEFIVHSTGYSYVRKDPKLGLDDPYNMSPRRDLFGLGTVLSYIYGVHTYSILEQADPEQEVHWNMAVVQVELDREIYRAQEAGRISLNVAKTLADLLQVEQSKIKLTLADVAANLGKEAEGPIGGTGALSGPKVPAGSPLGLFTVLMTMTMPIKETEIAAMLGVKPSTVEPDIRALVTHLGLATVSVRSGDGERLYELTPYARQHAIRIVRILAKLQAEHGARPKVPEILAIKPEIEASYDPQFQGTALLADDARYMAYAFGDVDLVKTFGYLPSPQQMKIAADLSIYPVEKLIQDLRTLPRGSEDYGLTLKALCLNHNFLSYIKIRREFSVLSDEAKKRDLADALRSIQFNILEMEDEGNGEFKDINRRTWSGRAGTTIAIISSYLKEFRASKPGETFVVGDFAVSDGTSALELAQTFMNDSVKIIASDRIIHLWRFKFNTGTRWLTCIFSPDGKVVQLIDDLTNKPIPADKLGDDAKRELEGLFQEQFNTSKRDPQVEIEKFSLLNPMAEEFAARHPGVLEFRAHDVFKPSTQKFHFIRALGLLMRGEYSYFNDETIKAALQQLGLLLYDDGILLSGTFWEENEGQFDLYKRSGDELRLVESRGYQGTEGWEAIGLSTSDAVAERPMPPGSPARVFEHLLKSDKPLTKDEIAAALNLKPSTVAPDIRALVTHLGLARSNTAAEGGEPAYELTEDARQYAYLITPILKKLQLNNARPLKAEILAVKPTIDAVIKYSRGEWSDRYKDILNFLQRHREYFEQKGKIFHNADGSTYGPTPLDVLPSLFELIQQQLGPLEGKRMLDLGCGDMRMSLFGARAHKMKATAVEKDPFLSKGAELVHGDALKKGLVAADDIRLLPATDAFEIPWNDYDVAIFYYTNPAREEVDRFRKMLEQKTGEMGDDGILAIVFTEPQIEYGLDKFPGLEPILPKPVWTSNYYVDIYVQLYRKKPAVQIISAKRTATVKQAATAFVDIEAKWGGVLADTLKIMASQAKDKARQAKDPKLATILIGLELNRFVPPEQRAMMQPLLTEISLRLEGYLRDNCGLENVKIVAGAGEQLANDIASKQRELEVPAANIVVMASRDTLESDVLKDLKSTETEDRAFFAEIDPTNLTGFNYVRLCEMLTISLKLAFRDTVAISDHPEIEIEFNEKVKRMIRLIPKAEPKETTKELKDVYDEQVKLLIAA